MDVYIVRTGLLQTNINYWSGLFKRAYRQLKNTSCGLEKTTQHASKKPGLLWVWLRWTPTHTTDRSAFFRALEFEYLTVKQNTVSNTWWHGLSVWLPFSKALKGHNDLLWLKGKLIDLAWLGDLPPVLSPCVYTHVCMASAGWLWSLCCCEWRFRWREYCLCLLSRPQLAY